MAYGTTFNPAQVMLGGGPGPYLNIGSQPPPSHPGVAKPGRGPFLPPQPPPPGRTLNTGSNAGAPSGPATLPNMGYTPPPNAPGGRFNNPLPAPPTNTPAPPSGILAPESIRATGSGPFDAAYRQNLATYGGGQFSRPGGSLSFNPTDLSTFPGIATGGGTAPVAGMPTSLMDEALGGQSFQWSPPPSINTSPGNFATLQDWMQNFLMNGRTGRQRSIL